MAKAKLHTYRSAIFSCEGKPASPLIHDPQATKKLVIDTKVQLAPIVKQPTVATAQKLPKPQDFPRLPGQKAKDEAPKHKLWADMVEEGSGDELTATASVSSSTRKPSSQSPHRFALSFSSVVANKPKAAPVTTGPAGPASSAEEQLPPGWIMLSRR